MTPSFSRASLRSLEEDVVQATTIGAIDDRASEPLKKDLRFITVENSPSNETDSLEAFKLSQYVESSSSDSAILHASDIFELEVKRVKLLIDVFFADIGS